MNRSPPNLAQQVASLT